MKVDITSLFLNSVIQGATATPAWGTSIGQRKSNNCRIEADKEGVTDLLIGMLYKSISSRSLLDISKCSSNRDVLLVSKFDKIFVNGIKLNDASFILMYVRESSKSHNGRLIISYPTYAKYDGVAVNKDTMNKIGTAIGCSEIGCWFVSEINIKNQDELHFKAHVVNPNKTMVYTGTSAERSQHWQQIVNNDNL